MTTDKNIFFVYNFENYVWMLYKIYFDDDNHIALINNFITCYSIIYNK